MGQNRVELSPCGTYRYVLRREWLVGSGRVCWVMLNPSTADGEKDDPTVRRCIGFSQAWGFQSLAIINLFALRATDPRALLVHPNPIGPDNCQWWRTEVQTANMVVAAWGKGAGKMNGEQSEKFCRLLTREFGIDLHVVALTADGTPSHPLYLRADLKPSRWTP